MYVLNTSVLQCVHFKEQLNVKWWDRRCFMKNFRLNTICNITQEPQELRRYNRACRFSGKSAVIKCHQLQSKVTSINRRSIFDQLATDTSIPILNNPQGYSVINHPPGIYSLPAFTSRCNGKMTSHLWKMSQLISRATGPSIGLFVLILDAFHADSKLHGMQHFWFRFCWKCYEEMLMSSRLDIPWPRLIPPYCRRCKSKLNVKIDNLSIWCHSSIVYFVANCSWHNALGVQSVKIDNSVAQFDNNNYFYLALLKQIW